MSLLLSLLLINLTTTAGEGVTAAPLAADLQLVRKSRTFDEGGGGTNPVVEVMVMATSVQGEAHAVAALDEVQRVLTLFDARRVDGPLARLRAEAGKSPVDVDAEVFAVLVELQRIARLTRGAFDVTAAACASLILPRATALRA